MLSLGSGTFLAGLYRSYVGQDFHCWWVAGRIAATGGDPYDAQQFVPAARTIPPSEARALDRCGRRLSYPPWTGAVLAAFGAVPLDVAAALWVSLAVFATVLAVHWTRQLAGLRPSSWVLVAVIAVGSEAFARTFAEGQFAAFTYALTAGAALAFRSNRDVAAGIATASLSVKPHTTLGFAVVLLALALLRRRSRLLGAALASGLVLVGLTVLLRPGWIPASVGASTSLGGSIPDRATIWNFAGSWVLATVMIALLVATVVLLIRRRGANDTEILGLAVAFSLVVAPYSWDHDFLVLTIPWSLGIAKAARMPPIPGRLLVLATLIVAAPLPWILAAVATLRGTESLSAVIPILTMVLLAIAIRYAPRPQVSPIQNQTA